MHLSMLRLTTLISASLPTQLKGVYGVWASSRRWKQIHHPMEMRRWQHFAYWIVTKFLSEAVFHRAVRESDSFPSEQDEPSPMEVAFGEADSKYGR